MGRGFLFLHKFLHKMLSQVSYNASAVSCVFRGKKTKCEKKPLFAFSHGCADQGAPALMGELSPGAGCVFTEGSDMPSSVAHKADVALKKDEVKKVELDVGADAESDKSQVDVTPPPTPLLDLLADQALAQEETLPVLQELLAEAAKKRFFQHWSFLDMQSPPPPPPPPQSSPVGFPVCGTCGDVFSQMLQAGSIRHVAAAQVQSFSSKHDNFEQRHAVSSIYFLFQH